jgi:DNA repair protein RecO (recombination protein O)
MGVRIGRTARRAARRVETPAFIVRSVPYGEGDVIVTALTEREGKVAAIVRGARRGSKRTSGALEPMHTVALTYEDKGTELVTMKEARVVKPRTRLLGSLEAIQAGGTLLRWARHMFPPRTPEPAAFETLTEVLDALEEGAAHPQTELACAGLRLLGDVGWGLELERCVRCGTPCPEDAAAFVDPQQGGIVCRRCGGARVLLSGPVRRTAIAALARKPGSPVGDDLDRHAKGLIDLVESAMAAHTGYEAG